MKITVEFEDQEEFDESIIGTQDRRIKSAMFELVNNFWRKWKHADTDPTLDEVKTAFFDLLYNENVDTENLG